jgi:hypothetical protein
MDGELSVGYVNRVAVANGYEDVLTLCRAVRERGGTIAGVLRLETHERNRLFGVLPNHCACDISATCGVTATHFNHHHVRWCPACLKVLGYFRGAWGLKLCCACARHKLLLVDECPSCRGHQQLLRCSIRCRVCGEDLSRANELAATEALVALHMRLEQALRQSRDQEQPRYVMEWLRLVKYLGPFLADPWHRRPGQSAGLHRIDEAMMLVNATALLLEDWPQNFHALLHRARSEHLDASHLAQAYGPLYRVLFRDLAAPSFDSLRLAFEQHLHDNWFGLLGRRNRWLRIDTICTHPRQSATSVAEKTRVGVAAIRHLADCETVSAHTVHHGSGRVARAFPEEVIQHIQHLKQDSVTLRDGALILRVRRRRVRELLDAELIRAWVDRRRANAATWWLSKSDVMVLATIGERITGAPDCRPSCVSLRTVLKTWRFQQGEFPALVRAMLAKELVMRRPLNPAAGLGCVELIAEELRAWLSNLRRVNQAWLSIDEAARRLGLKQQVAYELVARGLIVSSIQDRGRRIAPQAIDSFRCTYVSLSELAAGQSMAPRRMLALLTSRPVCGPRVDGARQYFYRREDVGDLCALVSDVDTTPAVGGVR